MTKDLTPEKLAELRAVAEKSRKFKRDEPTRWQPVPNYEFEKAFDESTCMALLDEVEEVERMNSASDSDRMRLHGELAAANQSEHLAVKRGNQLAQELADAKEAIKQYAAEEGRYLSDIDDAKAEIERLREALEQIAAIKPGDVSVKMPGHLAKKALNND